MVLENKENDDVIAPTSSTTNTTTAAADAVPPAAVIATDNINHVTAAVDSSTDHNHDHKNTNHDDVHHSEPHHDQHHHHTTKTYWYAPPYQRQRWGDIQIVPHTDWGDLFFDVFYVAGAYNIGNLLKNTPTITSFLYCSSIFLAIMNIWSNKVYYDGRFYYSYNDYFHRLYEIIVLCNLATIILHLVTSIELLSHPKQYPDIFILCFSILIGYTFSFGRLIEIVICVSYNISSCTIQSHQQGLYIESYYTALRDIYGHIPSFLCVLTATIYTGIQYFYYNHHYNMDDYYDNNSSSNSNTSSSVRSNGTYYNTSTTTTDDQHNNNYNNNDTDHLLLRQLHHRFLASDASEYTTSTNNNDDDEDHVAVWLLLGGVFGSVLYFISVVIYFTWHTNTNRTVPVNVNFIIKRYGEWIMLMLGESVLSLLIVDIVESREYYVTFISGLLSIMLLHYLHYQSQPSDPNLHAYRRSKFSAFIYYWFMQIYSLALIIFGTCYKMLLYEFIYKQYESKSDDTSTRRNRGLLSLLLNDPNTFRFLAGGDNSNESSVTAQYTTEERQQIDANFFSGSLAVIFICLDIISLAHRGIGEQWKRCNECRKSANTTILKYKKYFAWLLLLCRVGTIIFVATLSQWITDPNYLSAIGVAVIVLQLLIRFAGYYIFHSQEDAEDKAIERVIQYNVARINDLSLTKK